MLKMDEVIYSIMHKSRQSERIYVKSILVSW